MLKRTDEEQGLSEDTKYIDAKGLCEMLSLSPSTVEAMRVTGKLPPSIKLGRLRRWSLQAVREWLAEVQQESSK